ncbi:MAG TPA: endonuclease V [Marmoricola sp.]|nr:endonuclease V [Marmoricola sp.]
MTSWWPADPADLVEEQLRLADLREEPWRPGPSPVLGGCWVCFPRGATGPGRTGDPAWAAAVVLRGGRVVAGEVVTGRAGAPYVPGLMALRVGPLLEQAIRALPVAPDALLVDATGRDHPRRAGLARQLGAVLDLPTIGVTHRPLVAGGDWPDDARGARSPLAIGTEVVGCWLRTRPGTRPLAVHPGWRTDLTAAVDVVLRTTGQRRTPEPLRRARQLARRARGGQPPSR